MRHRNRGRKLGRSSSHRKALRRNLAAALFLQAGREREFVVTTLQKAKEVKPFAERLITLAKKGTLHARRRALSLLPDKIVVKKLFDEIGPRYAERQGGYTRILRYPKNRLGDNGLTAIFGLVEGEAVTATDTAEPVAT